MLISFLKLLMCCCHGCHYYPIKWCFKSCGSFCSVVFIAAGVFYSRWFCQRFWCFSFNIVVISMPHWVHKSKRPSGCQQSKAKESRIKSLNTLVDQCFNMLKDQTMARVYQKPLLVSLQLIKLVLLMLACILEWKWQNWMQKWVLEVTLAMIL